MIDFKVLIFHKIYILFPKNFMEYIKEIIFQNVMFKNLFDNKDLSKIHYLISKILVKKSSLNP